MKLIWCKLCAIIDHQGDPPIWATKHYVWATLFQFLGALVATKALQSVCSTVHCTLTSYTSAKSLTKNISVNHACLICLETGSYGVGCNGWSASGTFFHLSAYTLHYMMHK